MDLPINYVVLPETLFQSIHWPSPSTLASLKDPLFLAGAFGLAFVACAESLLSAVAVDRLHSGPRTNFDKELIAQGVGNAAAGLLGGLPITGVIVRSSANVAAGARSRLSTILHGAWLFLLVVTLPQFLELIPTAALAAVLVHTGFKLVSIQNAKLIYSYGRIPFAIYCITLAVIVGKDLLSGVIVGVGLTTLKLLFKVTRLWVRVELQDADNHVDIYLEAPLPSFAFPPSLTPSNGFPAAPRCISISSASSTSTTPAWISSKAGSRSNASSALDWSSNGTNFTSGIMPPC